MRVLDLFSGIGGFSLGLERAGHETVAFCEVDKFCQRVLKKHWPDIPIHNDIRTLDGTQYRGTVDIICGGFPCQDISIANQKPRGIEGERSGLYKEYLRVINETKPKYAIIENVKQLLRRGLGTVLFDLNRIGYDAEWHSFRASSFGSIQQRPRIIIIAYPSGKRKQRLLQGQDFISLGQRRACRQKDLPQVFSKPFGGDCWPQPIIRGGRSGFPNWVDRIRSLGNSVYPDMIEAIGIQLMDDTMTTTEKPATPDFKAIQRVAERLASYITDVKCDSCGISTPPHTADCTYFKEAKRLIEGEHDR
jgi:DNA (cytosine-5)-methyltransferase 1